MFGPIEDRLSRFTPSAAALDRDALFFAAGRASARSHRLWIALVVLLSATQALTLTLLWPRPVAKTPTVVPVPRVEAELPPSPSPMPPPPLIRRNLPSGLYNPFVDQPVSEDLVPDEPPLHVLGAGRSSLLN